MKRSEIFESFVKIAQEKGMISEADHAEHTETDFHETNPRHDSLSIEQIGKLYNTKPNLPKDMEYKNNIMEDAHPEPLVISPSHDKLNGLVESEVEGQNIRLRIVMKEPDGHLTQRKYAQKDLVLSLVRVANQLDNSDQEDLYKLADTCLAQASGPIQKKGWVLPVVIGAAALLSALYAKQHLRFHSDGFERDYQKTIEEIDDLLTSNTNFGVGYSYTPAFIQTVNQLKTVLAELHGEIQKINPLLARLDKPHTAPELMKMSGDAESQEVIRELESFKQEVEKVEPFLRKVVANFSNESYKQRSISQKGALTSIIDAPEILHGGKGLIADDFDDVAHALQTLMVDVANISKTLIGYENTKQKIAQELQESQEETKEIFNPAVPTKKTQVEETGKETGKETAEPAETASPFASLEEEGAGLFGGLS